MSFGPVLNLHRYAAIGVSIFSWACNASLHRRYARCTVDAVRIICKFQNRESEDVDNDEDAQQQP
jgi:hypothetical protein